MGRSIENVQCNVHVCYHLIIIPNETTCPVSITLALIVGKNTATELYVPAADNTLSFDIPEDLLHLPSLQLIWTKSNHTPCVCPVSPNLTSECACNKNDPENLVTVSGDRVTVSNLSDQFDQVLLYFVSSNASGCQQRCNVRSVAQTYRLIIRGKLYAWATSVLLVHY